MKKEMKVKIFQTVLLAVGLGFLWLNQAPLAYWVAQQREVLLGRYTVEQVTAQVILTPILLLVLWGIWMGREKTKEQKKQDAFKTTAVVLSVLAGIVVVDIAMRIVQRSQYIRTGHSFRRPPNQVRKGTFVDQPVTPFTYPNAPAGYPAHAYTFTTDSRGFRNVGEVQSCDVVVLGDSFAEGSGVSDEQGWPVLLAGTSGRQVYNLGMSGTSPAGYLDLLKEYAFPLRPKIVLCMLYEGNDFRDSNFRGLDAEPPRPSLMEVIYDASPLRRRIKTFLIQTLSPVGRHRFDLDPAVLADPGHVMYPVAWLPMEVPAGSGNYYTFDVKRMLAHCLRPEEFEKTTACRSTMEILEQLKSLCAENQARLAVVYAPDKPHLLLEADKEHLSPPQLRAFMALRKKHLPPAEQLLETVLPEMETFEIVMKQFCDEQEIPFVSLTQILREKMLEGTRAYFTYDQHWSPEGHQVVADYLAKTLTLE